jgi:hypothetical protein
MGDLRDDDLRERTRRNMERFNIPRGVDYTTLCFFRCPCHAPEWCADDPAIGCDLCRAWHGRLPGIPLASPGGQSGGD